MSLISNRLQLIPLNSQQVEWLVKNPEALSTDLSLEPVSLQIEKTFLDELHEACLSHTLPKIKENPVNYEWFTLWLIILTDENRAVGGLGISGLPDSQGESMLGYFVDERYEKRGIATEAVGLLQTYFLRNNNLKAIVASILEAHIASEKVLVKNGFEHFEKLEEGLKYFRRNNSC